MQISPVMAKNSAYPPQSSANSTSAMVPSTSTAPSHCSGTRRGRAPSCTLRAGFAMPSSTTTARATSRIRDGSSGGKVMQNTRGKKAHIMIETDPKLVRIHHLDLLEYFSDSEERLISQLDWLLDRTGNVREGRYWVYYSTSRWARELHLSPSTVQRTIAHLIRIGVLISRNYNHHAYDRTRWLTINYDRLGEMGIRAQHFCENDRARKSPYPRRTMGGGAGKTKRRPKTLRQRLLLLPAAEGSTGDDAGALKVNTKRKPPGSDSRGLNYC